MSEKVKLLELDINIEALTQNSAKAYQELESLRDQQKNLKKSTSDLKKEIEEYNKALKNPDVKKNAEEVANYTNKLKEAQGKLSENVSATVKNQMAIKQATAEYNLSLKVLDAYSQQQLNNIPIITKTDGSLNQLSAALSKNKAAYSSLTKEQQENTEIGQKLSKIISEQDAEYKRLHVGIGNTGVMVGTYKQQIIEAAKEMGIFGKINAEFQSTIAPIKPMLTAIKSEWKETIGHYKNAAKGTNEMTIAQKAATIATNLTSASLKLLKVALVSTGIGAIVVLLGSLVAYFMKSQKGIDQFKQIMAGANAIINVFVDRLIKLGSALVKLITFDFDGFKKDGVDAFSGIGTEIANDTRLAVLLERKIQDLTKAEVLLDIQRAASKRTIKELNRIGDDTSKSIDDRIEALNKAGNIESELSKKQLKIAEDRLANQLGEVELTEKGVELLERFRQGAIGADEAISNLGISESNLEDLEKLRDLFVEVENQQSELAEVGTMVQNKINSLLNEQISKQETAAKEAVEKAKERTEAALKESQTKLELYIAENDGKAKSLNGQLSFEKSIYDKQVDLFKQQLAAKQISQTEFDLLMVQAQKDLLQKQTELTMKHAEDEYNLYLAQNKSKVDSNKLLTDALVKQEEERLQAILSKQIEYAETQNKLGLISDNELTAMKLAVQEQFEADKAALHTTFSDQQKAYDDEVYNLQVMIDQLRGVDKFNQQQADLDRWYVNEIEAAKKQGKDTTAIDAYYAAKSQDIEKQKFMAKMQGASTVFGVMADLLGRETEAGKAAAVAQTMVNTFSTAFSAFQGMVETFPGPVGLIAGAIAAAAAVAAGIAQISKINQVDTTIPKAEHGAVIDIGGKRHSAGGTKFIGDDGTRFEAEKDEKLFILNRAASLSLGPSLSRLNESHGGKSLSITSSYLADGGAVSRTIGTQTTTIKNETKNLQFDYDLMAIKIADANRALPNPVTDVRDIITQVDKYNEVVNYASR